jgi:hypothetical protein
MFFIKKIAPTKYLLVFCVLGLSALSIGCTNKVSDESKTATDTVNSSIEKAIAAIQQTQQELYQHSAIANNAPTAILGGVYSDNVRIDANWNGDAAEILNKMALQRHFSFRQIGIKLPLPISLQVNKVTYKQALELIQTQIGYGAMIIMDNNRRELVLKYGSDSNPGNRIVVKQQSISLQPASAAISTKSAKGSVFSSQPSALPDIGMTCTNEGYLSRNKQGKPMKCINGSWRKS